MKAFRQRLRGQVGAENPRADGELPACLLQSHVGDEASGGHEPRERRCVREPGGISGARDAWVVCDPDRRAVSSRRPITSRTHAAFTTRPAHPGKRGAQDRARGILREASRARPCLALVSVKRLPRAGSTPSRPRWPRPRRRCPPRPWRRDGARRAGPLRPRARSARRRWWRGPRLIDPRRRPPFVLR